MEDWVALALPGQWRVRYAQQGDVLDEVHRGRSGLK